MMSRHGPLLHEQLEHFPAARSDKPEEQRESKRQIEKSVESCSARWRQQGGIFFFYYA